MFANFCLIFIDFPLAIKVYVLVEITAILFILRGAEILFSLALAHSRHHGKFPCDDLYPKLLSARKELALFQHHDGITGTAKDHVVVDYGERMLRAIRDSAKVMETSSNFLLTSNKEDFQELYADVPLIKFGESRERHDSLSVKDTIIISNTPRSVVFYNSLAQERQQVVFVHISEEFVQVGLVKIFAVLFG